jgi:signal transduction histidine kinase
VTSSDLERLADQQASLQRVAALVGRGVPSADVFAAIAREVASVLRLSHVEMSRFEPDGSAVVIGAWSERADPFEAGTRWALGARTVSRLVRDTGRPARLDDYAELPGAIAAAARDAGIRCGAGAPIIVDGKTWGVMATGASDAASLPAGIEDRLAAFTELVAAAIAFSNAREALGTLAAEQAALRRVATLVAQGAAPGEVFGAVAGEIGQLANAQMVLMSRYDADGAATVVGAWGEHPLTAGTRWTLEGPSISKAVLETGASARMEHAPDGPGAIADLARSLGVHSRVGVPIVVDGKLWGVIAAGAAGAQALPDGIETRLGQFTELVATAISNSQARADLRELADEQAALRRVATLVAQGAAPAVVLTAVAREVAERFELPMVEMVRYDSQSTATVVGATGDHPFQPGTRWVLDGPSLTATVRRTGRPARLDTYDGVPGSVGAAARAGGVHAGVAAPIFVDGELWGALAAGGGPGVKLAPEIEVALEQFTELLATALSNTQARDDLGRLVQEQAALRRIATLVAQGAASAVVFEAVCRETGRLLAATTVNLCSFTADGVNVTLAGWSVGGIHVPTGTRLPLEGNAINTLVRETAAPGRVDSYAHAGGALAGKLRELGIRSEVGAPVIVEGEVWGVLIAGTDAPEPLPAGTELRLASFAELVATAIANATARTELVESRARIVRGADEQRRRVVRDLHDGAQQRLVHAIMTLQRAQRSPPDRVQELVGEALEQARLATNELRELAHGIHPAVLTHRGLRAAVEALADRAPIPVEIAIGDERFASTVESAAYFITAEALTTVAKYAQATTARVEAAERDGHLELAVSDDGVGGAAPYPGSGLTGLRDRVAALDGTLEIQSRAGAGTRIRAILPLGAC